VTLASTGERPGATLDAASSAGDEPASSSGRDAAPQ
jgi:hypothetical protein